MRILLTSIATFFVMFTSAQAADVVCSCDKPECTASDVRVNFIPSNPGVYMTVEFAFGDKNTEGFATVTRNKADGSVVYRLANFVLLKKDNEFSIPGRPGTCN